MLNTWRNGDGSEESAPQQQSGTEMAAMSGGDASPDQPNEISFAMLESGAKQVIVKTDYVSNLDQRTTYINVPPGAQLRVVGRNEIEIEDLAAKNERDMRRKMQGWFPRNFKAGCVIVISLIVVPLIAFSCKDVISSAVSGKSQETMSTTIERTPTLQIPTPDQTNSAENQLDIDMLEDLQKKLKQCYRRATLPRIPWMHKGRDLPFDDYYADLSIVSSEKEIELEEFFENTTHSKFGNSKDEVPETLNRIFVEGKAGFGKTTLITKLAYDWATNEEYLQRFRLVFAIKLRRIQDVKSALQKQAEDCGFKHLDKLEDLIDKNINVVLILLDGYDEVPPGNAQDSIRRVLYKTDYNEATVVLTCRNGMFNKHNEEQQALSFTSIERQFEFWDKKIEVKGIDSTGLETMLENYLATDECDLLLTKIRNLTRPISEILTSPLILMLIGFLCGEGREVELDTKNTNLFKNITNGLVSYNVRKQNESINRNIDLFGNQQVVPGSLKKDFVEFGKICLDYLDESEFQFENSDLMERIYSRGFLIKTDSKYIYETKTSFEPIHRSFAEFFAAFFVWHQFNQCQDNQLEDETIRTLHRIFFKSQGTSLVHPFLIGMLKNKSHILFNQLAPNAQLYDKFQNGLWAMLNECEETQQVMESLLTYVPLRMVFSGETFAKTEFFGHFMQKASEHSNLYELQLNTDREEEFRFPQKIYFERITIVIGGRPITEEIYENYRLMLKTVSSSQVMFFFINEFKAAEMKENILCKFINIFENHALKRRAYQIDNDSTCNLLTTCFKTKAAKGNRVHHLNIDVTGDGNWKEFLKLLLEENQLETLYLNIKNEKSLQNVEDVLKWISTSNLLGFTLQNELNRFDDKYAVNLNSLGELKNWDQLQLYGMKVSSDTTKNFSTNLLSLLKLDANAEQIMLNSHISTLLCTSTVLDQLFNSSETSKHPIFLSVTELAFYIGDECLQSVFWDKLRNFKRIEKLTLILFHEKFVSFEDISNYLRLTRLTALEIRVQNSNFDAIGNFINHLVSLPREKYSLTRIHINVVDKLPELSELIIPLLTSLQKNILEEVDISWLSYADCLSESMDWVDTEKFGMELSSLGTKKSDREHWRTWYNFGNFFPRFRITLK